MSDERLKEIKDSIDLQLELSKQLNVDNELLMEEKELYEYVKELKKKLEEANKKLYLCTPEIPQNVHEKYVSYVDLVNEIYELKKQLQIKGEGFKAVNEELREYAEENEKLKKQLEELMTGKRPIISSYHSDAYITHEMEYQERKRLEKQQQKFINWLKRKLFILSDEMVKLAIGIRDTDYQKVKLKIYQEILQKYKEIVGGKDENNL